MIQMRKILPVFVSTLPITKDADNPMNQSELEDNICGRRQARENACH